MLVMGNWDYLNFLFKRKRQMKNIFYNEKYI